jgi:hypothetical protein
MKPLIEIQTAKGPVLINVNSISSVHTGSGGQTVITLVTPTGNGGNHTFFTAEPVIDIKARIVEAAK